MTSTARGSWPSGARGCPPDGRESDRVGTVIVDAAGARMGGAARYLDELRRYLASCGRDDVTVIGAGHGLSAGWLLRRELAGRLPRPGRRVALNNVGFLSPGAQRWTLLRNVLHFLTADERAGLDPRLRTRLWRDAIAVRQAARRSDVLVAPSSAMAERVATAEPGLGDKIVVRPHPLSVACGPTLSREPAVLCPVLFASYKQMPGRLAELLAALDEFANPATRVWVTADRSELPQAIAGHPRVQLVGRRDHQGLSGLQARASAVYFPGVLESFGYPMAEARAAGQPVIARDTAHNQEIAGQALCGYAQGDAASLRDAVGRALTLRVAADPAPFDPSAYFGWLLGAPG